jgi:hypothetical protein
VTAQAVEAGVDTVRLLYRLHDERQQVAASELWARPRKLAGAMTVGYVRDYELIWVEGRPRTLYGDEGLLHPDALSDVDRLVRDHLRDVGATDARSVGLSRVDPTVTLRFETPAQGWAFLRGCAALDVPRRKPEVIGSPVETAYWLTPAGRRMERVYDKGLEAALARPGILVRMEAQTRHRAADRTTAEWWNMDRVQETFQKRFGALAAAGSGLTVASEQTIREQLREWVLDGRIGATQARTLLGHLAAESVGMPMSRRTRYRNRAELRRLGLAHALDGADGEDLSVDVGELLREALTTERWHG